MDTASFLSLRKHIARLAVVALITTLSMSVSFTFLTERKDAYAAEDGLKPTPNWMILYGSIKYEDGDSAPAKTRIEAIDPSGNLAGYFLTSRSGSYGLMALYKDDPDSAIDEGFDSGDSVTLRVDGELLSDVATFRPDTSRKIDLVISAPENEGPVPARNAVMVQRGQSNLATLPFNAITAGLDRSDVLLRFDLRSVDGHNTGAELQKATLTIDPTLQTLSLLSTLGVTQVSNAWNSSNVTWNNAPRSLRELANARLRQIDEHVISLNVSNLDISGDTISLRLSLDGAGTVIMGAAAPGGLDAARLELEFGSTGTGPDKGDSTTNPPVFQSPQGDGTSGEPAPTPTPTPAPTVASSPSTGLPDLVPTIKSVKRASRIAVTVDLEIENRGPNNDYGHYTIRFLCDGEFCGSATRRAHPSGTVEFEQRLYVLKRSLSQVTVIVDSTDRITEGSESNNTASRAVGS